VSRVFEILARGRAAAAVAAVGFVACGPAPTAPAPAPQPRAVDASVLSGASTIDDILDRWLALRPAWGREVGLHEHDGKVADYDAAAIDAFVAFLRDARGALEALDAAGLSPDEALDVAILKNHIALELFDLEERRLHRQNPRFYGELFNVSAYVDFDYAPLEHRAERLVAHEEAALAQASRVIDNLDERLSKPVVETAMKSFAGYAEYLRGDVVKLVGGVGDAAFRERFAATNEKLAAAAAAIADRLEKEWLPRAGDDVHVLGEEKYLRFVAAQEGRVYDLAAFKAMAEADLAKNREAYRALRENVKPTRPKKDELLAVATDLVEASRRFVVEEKLVTIPSDDRCEVRETPPYMRWNAAFLNMTGPFDPARNAFYYITLPDPTWPVADQESYVFPHGVLQSTTVHEGYPGHFLHGLWIRKAPTRVQKMVGSYSFTEGWAHYTEQLMIERGFRTSEPQNELGQLSDALLRNCRFVVSIGVHAEGMSLDQATRRFVDDCFQDEAGARQQAVRATFDPGYFAYTLGKLQILELRGELERELGERFSLQRFHDALMAHGAPPLALIRDRVKQRLASAR
jgi:uncharacterized protein (DUF885 family)